MGVHVGGSGAQHVFFKLSKTSWELEEPDSLTDGAGRADIDTSQGKTDGGRTPKKAGRSKARKAKNTFSKVRFNTNGSEKETGSQKQP